MLDSLTLAVSSGVPLSMLLVGGTQLLVNKGAQFNPPVLLFITLFTLCSWLLLYV